MRTSDPDIFAVGDAVEVKDFVTGQWTLIPLAGPANRQGRIVADVIAGAPAASAARRARRSARSSRGSSRRRAPARRCCGPSATPTSRRSTSTRTRTRAITPARRCWPSRCCSASRNGKVLGAQVLGEDGVPKRIDAFAMAIQAGMTDLRPRGSRAVLRASVRQREGPRELRGDGGREPAARGHAVDALGVHRRCVPARRAQPPGARSGGGRGRGEHPAAPVARAARGTSQGSRNPGHLPFRGARVYATRILAQNGFTATNISGGMLARSHRA